jgi:hypothetical protein
MGPRSFAAASDFSVRPYGSRSSTPGVGYAKFFSRSHRAVIRVYDEAGNVMQTHEHAGDFKESRVHFFCGSGLAAG